MTDPTEILARVRERIADLIELQIFGTKLLNRSERALRTADAILDLLNSYRGEVEEDDAAMKRCRHDPYQGYCAHCGVPFRFGRPDYGTPPLSKSKP